MLEENLTQNNNTDPSTNTQTNSFDIDFYKNATMQGYLTGKVFEHLYQDLKADASGAMTTIIVPAVADVLKTTIKIPKTDFAKAFKAYKKEADKKASEANKLFAQTTVRKTAFTGQPITLVSKNYICNDAGIRDLETGKCICELGILPVAALRSIDKTGVEMLEIAFQDYKKHWRSRALACSEAYSRQGVIALADDGAAVTSEDAGQIARYLCHMTANNGDILPEKFSIGRAGWYHNPDDGMPCFYPYATNGQEVLNSAPGRNRASLGAVHTKGSEDAWLDMIKPLRVSNLALRAFLAASFASPLISIIGANPFFTHLYAETASGKTVSLKLAASIWANPAIGDSAEKYICSLSSTDNSLEFLASLFHSLPLCLDELQTKGGKETDSLVYRLTQGTGRERATKAGSLNGALLSWKNIILTTGEMAINGANPEDSSTAAGAGAIGRVINVRADSALIPPGSGDDICRICDNNFGWAGQKFILSIIDKQDEIRARFKSIRNKISPKTNTVSKQYDSVAFLLLADELAEQTVFGGAGYSEELESFLLETIRPTATVNANTFSLDWIRRFVTEHSSKFVRHHDNEKTWVVDPRVSYIGVISDTEVCIEKSIFAEAYQQKFRNSSCAQFLRWAEKEGLIYADTKRKDRARKFIPGEMNIPCIVFWKNKLFGTQDDPFIGAEGYLLSCATNEPSVQDPDPEPETKDDDFTVVWEDESYEQEKITSDF